MDFSKAKELMKLQQEIAKIQKELSNTHVESEADGLVLTINCQLKVVEAKVEKPELLKDAKKLEAAIVASANKGLKKAQEIAAAKMQGVAKQMGIDLPDQMPGMA
jgi:DNA-binding protein YbaB